MLRSLILVTVSFVASNAADARCVRAAKIAVMLEYAIQDCPAHTLTIAGRHILTAAMTSMVSFGEGAEECALRGEIAMLTNLTTTRMQKAAGDSGQPNFTRLMCKQIEIYAANSVRGSEGSSPLVSRRR